jgi:flagellar basal body rod protein FlgG
MLAKGLLTLLIVFIFFSQISFAKIVRKEDAIIKKPDPVNVQALSLYEKNYDVLVENASNSQTPGYKERVLVGKYDGENITYEVKTRFAPGGLVATNGPLDFALQNPGFFVLELPDGKLVYTRDGRLTLDPEGYLVSVAGNYKILSQLGPILIPAGGKITVDGQGQLYVENVEIQKFWVVDFENYDALQRLSGSFFTLPENSEVKQIPQNDPRILQGFEEASNVEMVNTLIDLPSTSKKYDANAKALQIMGKVRQAGAEIGRP